MIQLDENQAAAATTDSDRVLVTACPGSGKTRTLTARFNHMVEEMGISPFNIVMITFTRYASGEIKERLGRKASQQAFVGTFHAFALMLVKMYGIERGWEGHWLTLLDEAEVELEERAILKDMGFINSRGAWTRCKSNEWDEYRNDKLNGTNKRYREKKPTQLDKDLDLAWKMFMDRLRAENVLTFGTMILEAIELLKIPAIQEKIANQFSHLLVDEAQDSDKNQWNLLELLTPKSLWVCGDVDQAIFQWRGAAPELFREFSENATRYDLPNSYRFGFNIAAPANNLIQNNKERIDTAITAISENEGSVRVVQDAQYDEISKILLQELGPGGFKPSDIAVLSRRHATLECLADYLFADRIPFTKIGGQDAIPATAQFRTVRGYLRLSVNPMESRAFMAISTPEGISIDALWSLRARANEKGVSLLEAYHKKLPTDLVAIQKRLHERDPYTDYLPVIQYMQDIIRIEAISDNQELLEYLSMESMQDQLRTVEDTVTLCTIHAAKGLGWPVVVIVGLNLSQFPSPRSIKEGRIEEERRLAYVACTRAEQKLYLVQHIPESPKDGPSQFMDEFGELPVYEKPMVDIFDGDDLVM